MTTRLSYLKFYQRTHAYWHHHATTNAHLHNARPKSVVITERCRGASQTEPTLHAGNLNPPRSKKQNRNCCPRSCGLHYNFCKHDLTMIIVGRMLRDFVHCVRARNVVFATCLTCRMCWWQSSKLRGQALTRRCSIALPGPNTV